MGNIYLTCPTCRSKFNADDRLPFTFCPQCSTRVVTKVMDEDEVRRFFIANAVKCNRQCEKTGYKCRCGCVVEVYKQ